MFISSILGTENKSLSFMIFTILALTCLLCGLGLLVVLSIIDLKVGLLPNVYNAGLALCGIIFHGLTRFSLIGIEDVLLGALAGGGLLYFIRFVGNHLYKQDTLGLGDVKLLAAAGIWLGPSGVLSAIFFGAVAGLLHGIAVGTVRFMNTRDIKVLYRLSIPAGPGFAIGIVIAVVIAYGDWVVSVLRSFTG